MVNGKGFNPITPSMSTSLAQSIVLVGVQHVRIFCKTQNYNKLPVIFSLFFCVAILFSFCYQFFYRHRRLYATKREDSQFKNCLRSSHANG